ncbi:hypothetical protein [Candidatus Nitrotoga sp. 1052]|uniref:hypothetical protein n=1 Tax=Candidatus Nitrotoga sp. 1052 TaxID=2886964 RepID=UPI001EF5A3DD|nr:hypothetical protein [Candidatus Nitrotoga sp. 1052]
MSLEQTAIELSESWACRLRNQFIAAGGAVGDKGQLVRVSPLSAKLNYSNRSWSLPVSAAFGGQPDQAPIRNGAGAGDGAVIGLQMVGRQLKYRQQVWPIRQRLGNNKGSIFFFLKVDQRVVCGCLLAAM